MSWVNYDDVLGQLQAHGLDITSLEVGTARAIRCRERDGDREKRGWYWLNDIELDGPQGRELYIVGSYGIYRGADPGKVKVTLSKSARISEDQRKAIAARHAENARRAKALRQTEMERAGAEASRAWSRYRPEGHSEYLSRKAVQPHGVRFSPSGNGTLAVPMQDTAGRIWGLQIIRGQAARERGKLEKEYWPKGLGKQGHYHMIGAPQWILLIAEGYATAATLHEATGYPVAVAFDAGNILPVATELHKAYRTSRVLICADDDYLGKTNAGVDAAQAAALAVGGAVCVPQFPIERGGRKLTDFNDLATLPEGGPHLVRQQVEAAIHGAGWMPPKGPASAGLATGGEGGGRRRAVSVMTLDEAIERFIPIDDGTGKNLWDTWTRRIVAKDQMLSVLPAGVRGDDIKRHPLWIDRGAYYLDQLGFDPTERDPDILLNTWRGWPMQPVAGRCDRQLELLDYLCNYETTKGPEIAAWLLKWMAYPLQHPGAKMSSAVIMHGPQGTGKSAIFQTYAKIFGDYATVLNQRGLEDKFNSDWADSKLFILAEEVVTRAEMWHIKNELKELVTGEWIRVNPKNIAAYRQRNQVNIVYLSNEGQPLPLENDDRRHLVIWTPGPLSEAFYDELWQEIDNGGAAAMYHYLLNLDLGDFHPKKRPPMTEAKRELIDLSKQSDERFLAEWTAGETEWPCMPCLSGDLYTAYQRWCRANGVRFPRESNMFLGRVGKLNDWSNKSRLIYTKQPHLADNKAQRRVVMPAVELLERHGHAHSPAQDRTEWLSDCVRTFREALNHQESGEY